MPEGSFLGFGNVFTLFFSALIGAEEVFFTSFAFLLRLLGSKGIRSVFDLLTFAPHFCFFN